MKREINILRIDPVKRTIVAMTMRCGNNATSEVRRILRAKQIGWRELIEVNGTVLTVAGGVDLPQEVPGWRLRGGEDSGGITICFGKGAKGGMAHVPIDRAWLDQRIQWVAGEDIQDVVQKAEAAMPMLGADVREAMARALPSLSDGAMWLQQDDKALWGVAQAIGLTTPSTAGQRLSPMGVKVHEMLLEEAAGAG